VNLEFSSDNGQTWSSIAQNINAASGSYQWTVPNIYSSKCLVKVSDASNGSTWSMQFVPFKIIPNGVKSGLPSFSYSAGYYTNPISLELSGIPGSKIYYTLDGSEPTDLSPEYVQPLNIEHHSLDSSYWTSEQNISATHAPQFPLTYIRTAPIYQTGPSPSVLVQTSRDL
jgi:hypothetical protein